MAKLVMSVDGVVMREFDLEQKIYKIGRKPTNDIQIDDITISGDHAEIEVNANMYLVHLSDVYVADKGSTNGTLVNGKKIKKQILRHGDVIQLGRHEFKFLDDAAPDFERTVVLQSGDVKASPATGNGLVGFITILNGPKAGQTMELVKTYTSVGHNGTMAVISKRQQGYFVSQVSGKKDKPGKGIVVNGTTIGAKSVTLKEKDVIDISGLQIEFHLK